MSNENKTIFCGIYTRKSHNEGLQLEFNSLDAQRESAENYIASQRMNGWVALPQKYDDGGFTGGNMERPALKQLLSDVKEGKVNCVVVYKIDRLSRSLVDFMKLIELFNQYNVSFVSVTQHFSTTDSAGRMMLNILMTFSQYEREIIGDRIRDSIAGAKRRGKFCGGSPSFGYDADFEAKKLVVNKKEAETVNFVFKRYLQLGSAKKIAQELNEKGCRTKIWTSRKNQTRGGQKWNGKHIYRMLRNPIYKGIVEHKGNVFPGEHEGIIKPELWDNIQSVISENARRKSGNAGIKINAPLQGVLRCGHCGGPMSLSYSQKSRKKRYGYYLCMDDHRRAESVCPVRRVPAGDIEKTVIDHLGAIFRTPKMLANVWREAEKQQKSEKEEALVRKREIEKELEDASGNADRKSLRELSKELIRINKELKLYDSEPVTERDISDAFDDMQSLWDELFPVERQRLIKLLVEKIEIHETGLDLILNTHGMSSLVSELVNVEKEDA
jgi:site-specific DNA recombinase